MCKNCQNPNSLLKDLIVNRLDSNQLDHVIERNNVKSLEAALDCSELWNLESGITVCKECYNLLVRDPKLLRDLLNNRHFGDRFLLFAWCNSVKELIAQIS